MEAVTHLEKVIVGEASAVTHLEKVIAGEVSAVTYTEKVITGEAPPITHLQKVIAGEASPVTHLEYIWAGGSPTPTEHEYTGVVPYTFRADGSPLMAWRISGNTVQSGTPTPDNPITPQGCGVLETSGAHSGQYKIPISSANTTTPVYLGEVETTRRIKKLVLTGEEEWQFFSDSIGSLQFYINNISLGGVTQSSCVSNIAPYGATAPTRPRYDYGCYLVTSGSGIAFQMKGAKDTFTGITAWKSYLAAQYANGTPVTVWYVLAEPTTGIVNEPLMKIGDYADEVSNVGTIPTNNGSTTIDVETTLKPSEVYIKYKGR